MNREKEQINILYCTDTNYAMPMTVSITSVFENSKDFQVTVYVFYSFLSEDQKQKLYTLAEQYNQTVALIHIDEHYFEDAPTLRWSKETYYRLLLTELLPNNLEKVLYLDCDIIVNKSLGSLYNMNLDDYFMSALRTEMSYSDFGTRLKLKPEGYYYQCGVILFNLYKCRNYLSYEKSIEAIKEIGSNLIAVDQDVLNVMFYGKIKDIVLIYNNDEITNFYRNNKSRFFNYVNQKSLKDTVILHYAAGKPWNNLFPGSCEDIWYHYLKKSPYSYLHKQKYATLKYKFLRLGIIKTLLFEYVRITPIINNVFKKIVPTDTYHKLKGFYRKNIK